MALPALPELVLQRICELLEYDPSTLHTMALVSRSWYSVAQRQLYRHIDLRIPYGTWGTYVENEQLAMRRCLHLLYRTFLSRPDHALCIRTIYYSAIRDTDSFSVYYHFSTIISLAINLRELSFEPNQRNHDEMSLQYRDLFDGSTFTSFTLYTPTLDYIIYTPQRQLDAFRLIWTGPPPSRHYDDDGNASSKEIFSDFRLRTRSVSLEGVAESHAGGIGTEHWHLSSFLVTYLAPPRRLSLVDAKLPEQAIVRLLKTLGSQLEEFIILPRRFGHMIQERSSWGNAPQPIPDNIFYKERWQKLLDYDWSSWTPALQSLTVNWRIASMRHLQTLRCITWVFGLETGFESLRELVNLLQTGCASNLDCLTLVGPIYLLRPNVYEYDSKHASRVEIRHGRRHEDVPEGSVGPSVQEVEALLFKLELEIASRGAQLKPTDYITKCREILAAHTYLLRQTTQMFHLSRTAPQWLEADLAPQMRAVGSHQPWSTEVRPPLDDDFDY